MPRSSDTPVFSYADILQAGQLKLWVDLSTHCNARCPQCHRTNPNGLDKAAWLPIVQWSAEQFEQAFPPHMIKHASGIEICGTWGDPMMNKDISEIVDYILDNSKAYITINTNGSIRDEHWWWKFGYKLQHRGEVYWAIEGITNEQHAYYRRGTELDKILRNMEAFSAAGGHSCVFTVVFKHNEADIYHIASMCHDYGAEKIFFVKSNRFYRDNRYDFVDEQGQHRSLLASDIPNNDQFFWKTWDLNKPETWEVIADEAAKSQQV